MSTKLNIFNQAQLKKELPNIRPGDTVKIYQKIPASVKTTAGEKKSPPAGGKEKTQAFEGIVLAKKHGKGITSTITVRKVISGIGVERIFPIHSPTIEKIEISKRGKVRRAKLYYLRKTKGKKTRLKKREFIKATVKEKPKEEKTENNKTGE